MSNIHLYTTFYPELMPARLLELLESLKKNIKNSSIKSITVFNEGGDLSAFKSSKLQIIPIKQRPTYQDFINYYSMPTQTKMIFISSQTQTFILIQTLKF